MNIYTVLKQQARAKRDAAIEAVHERYRETLSEIKHLQRRAEQRFNGTAYQDRKIKKCQRDTPLTRLGLPAAAERVLSEGKPLRIVELVVELQSRGYRPRKDPRVMLSSLKARINGDDSIAGAWADQICARSGVHGLSQLPGDVVAACGCAAPRARTGRIRVNSRWCGAIIGW